MGSAPDDLNSRPPARPERAAWPPARTTAGAAAEPRPAPPPRPGTGASTEPRPGPSPAKARPARVVAATPATERRYRQTINRVDLWSVLKVSVCFYICSMAVLMVALIALWLIADAAGVIHNVENFLGDLLQTKDFTFLDGEILRGALLVAAVIVVLLIVVTVIAAAFYNLFAEIFGGVELTITEDETEL